MPAVACFPPLADVIPPPADVIFPPSDVISPPADVTRRLSPTPWSPSLSSSLYKIDGWGAPYFSVNPAGNISVKPHGAATSAHQEIDLMKVVQQAAGSKPSGGLGLHTPLLIRFPEVLQHRLESLNSAFDFAVRSTGYGAHYQGVYPVKCNQDRYVVEDLVRFGSPYRFGLEAGSKPELLLAMSCLIKGSPDAFLICNGYKDVEYVSLALNARSMGLNCVIVLEQEEELDTVIETSRRLNIKPVIGLRAKLRTKHSGHFGSTSGEKGKFGLTTTQILSVVSKLKQHEMLDCLQLLHFHIGSQIPSTALLADGVAEAGQIYCELTRLGAAMRVVDVGGGLGIDYDGSRSGSDLSVGYSLDEYALTVVQSIRFACDQKGVKHPVLCSESGRALVSHHSVLIFEAFCKAESKIEPGRNLVYFLEQLADEARVEYRNLMTAGVKGDFEMCRVYMEGLKNRVAEQFKDGVLGLEHLAAVDELCELVSKEIGAAKPGQNYHINLSLFTSIPDFWAIGQLFPIVPIHRLTERPTVNGTLLDLTCDSDGKISKFINGESTLPLHEISNNNNGGYYLGMFLGGAYQEALGGLHNLFGGPSIVRVMQHEGPHGFVVTRAVSGPSNADVLRAMQHQPEEMFEVIKERIEERGLGPSRTGAISEVFGSMPYLTFGANVGTDGMGWDSEGSSGVTEDLGFSEDDEEWEMMRCLSV